MSKPGYFITTSKPFFLHLLFYFVHFFMLNIIISLEILDKHGIDESKIHFSFYFSVYLKKIKMKGKENQKREHG